MEVSAVEVEEASAAGEVSVVEASGVASAVEVALSSVAAVAGCVDLGCAAVGTGAAAAVVAADGAVAGGCDAHHAEHNGCSVRHTAGRSDSLLRLHRRMANGGEGTMMVHVFQTSNLDISKSNRKVISLRAIQRGGRPQPVEPRAL